MLIVIVLGTFRRTLKEGFLSTTVLGTFKRILREKVLNVVILGRTLWFILFVCLFIIYVSDRAGEIYRGTFYEHHSSRYF